MSASFSRKTPPSGLGWAFLLNRLLKLLSPQPFLPVPFSGCELERVERPARQTAVLAAAAITCDDITHDAVVQQPVEGRRTEQHRPGEEVLIEDHRQNEERCAGRCQQRHPEPLRKIFLAI